MWVALGFPAASHVEAVTLDSIPAMLRPEGKEFRSPFSTEVNRRRDRTFTRKNKRGKWLFNMDYLRPLMQTERKLSEENYREGRLRREKRTGSTREEAKTDK